MTDRTPADELAEAMDALRAAIQSGSIASIDRRARTALARYDASKAGRVDAPDAEAVIVAMANTYPVEVNDDTRERFCILCDAEEHDASCPWLMAQRWVAARGRLDGNGNLVRYDACKAEPPTDEALSDLIDAAHAIDLHWGGDDIVLPPALLTAIYDLIEAIRQLDGNGTEGSDKSTDEPPCPGYRTPNTSYPGPCVNCRRGILEHGEMVPVDPETWTLPPLEDEDAVVHASHEVHKAMKPLLHAEVTRSDGYWVATISDIPGAVTQAKDEEELPRRLAEVAKLMGGVDVEPGLIEVRYRSESDDVQTSRSMCPACDAELIVWAWEGQLGVAYEPPEVRRQQMQVVQDSDEEGSGV